jgi:hypothetical protein
MPYNPTVNDESGKILAEAKIQNQRYRQAEQQAMWEGISNGISNIGTALTGVLEKKQEEASKATAIGEALNTMQSTLPTYGAEGVALQEIITKRMADAGNNLDKMSGIYMAFQPAMQNLQSRFNQNAQIEGYKDLADYKSANTPAAAPTQPKLDANYGRQFYQGLRQNGRTHEQALGDMDNAGLNWAKPFIEGQKNPFFQ